MPAFSHRHIKDLYPIFWDKSVALARALEENMQTVGQSTKVFDVADWLARATLDILGSAGLGEEFDTLHHPDNEICSVYRNVFEQKPPQGALAMGLFLLREALTTALHLQRNDSIATATKTLTGVACQLIADKRAKISTEKREGDGRDIISVALASGSFTDSMLENHLLTFLAAGHETTATSMTWALYALCLYVEVQQRLRDEIRSRLPQFSDESSATPMTAELLDSLPYLHAVCNEVFRIYPPAGLTRRVAVKNTSVLGQFIPAGTEIVISPRALNVSRELWGADAAVFNPNRWLKPSQANTGGGLTNYSFMTFLHGACNGTSLQCGSRSSRILGPRSCIGQGFARGEFASLLAALVGTFEMTLAEESEIIIETGLTSRPKGGLRVQFRRV